MSAKRTGVDGIQRVGWTLTIPNYTDVDEQLFHHEKIAYFVYGKEIAPTTLLPHLQAYVHFKRNVRMSAVLKIFGPRHVEAAIGSPAQNRCYCSKGEQSKEEYTKFHEHGPNYGLNANVTEGGIFPIAAGEKIKKDWELAKELSITGHVEDIQASIYIPHYETLHKIANDHMEKPKSRDVLPDEWHHGPTGVGKSRPLREAFPEAFIKDADKWWDGYALEPIVIVEDIDKYDVALGRQVKLWTDHYPFPANFKHKGSKLIRPEKIFFTSNYTPSEIWLDVKTHGPIERRVKLVDHAPPFELNLPYVDVKLPWSDETVCPETKTMYCLQCHKLLGLCICPI